MKLSESAVFYLMYLFICAFVCLLLVWHSAHALFPPHSDPSTLSYCSSQWSFSTLSSVTQLSAHCCGWDRNTRTHSYTRCRRLKLVPHFIHLLGSWVSHPLVKKNRRVVLASFLLLFTGVGKFDVEFTERGPKIAHFNVNRTTTLDQYCKVKLRETALKTKLP